MADIETLRTPLHVMLSVWKALFLREAVNRISRTRSAWVWLLVEPLIHMAFIVSVFTVIRQRVVVGIDTAVWIMVGLLAFFLFRRPAQQGHTAISANRALFGFRQVKPVDVVVVRAGLEGFLMLVTAALVLAGAGFLGYPVIPDDPQAVLAAAFGMWLLGLSFALVASVANELTPELGWIIAQAVVPLYIASGVVIPISRIPQPYRDWLMFNPLVHGLEATRQGFSAHYHAAPETSLAYLYCYAVVAISFGLALHVRFAERLAAR